MQEVRTRNKKEQSSVWIKDTSNEERKTLTAAFAGYATDAFDYMIYPMLIPTLIVVWGMTKAQAGYIATGALITSAIGGWAAGVLADKYGRVRMLQLTVLWFSFFTFLSGFTNSYEQLFVTRALQGLGFGGEWSVGSVLVAEMIQARHRGKAVGLVQSSWAVGWGGAAIAFWAVYALVAPELAWRILFWIGVLPAFLILYLRRNLKDPEVYHANRAKMKKDGDEGSFLEIFSPTLLSTTLRASLLATGMQGAYYAVTTWLPTYLNTERQLSVLNTSGYLLVLILGSFLGFLTSAYLSDRIGRRHCFMLFACQCRRADRHLHADPHHRLADAAAWLPARLLPQRHLRGDGGISERAVPQSGAGFRPGLLLQRRSRRRLDLPGTGRLPERHDAARDRDRLHGGRRLPAGHPERPHATRDQGARADARD